MVGVDIVVVYVCEVHGIQADQRLVLPVYESIKHDDDDDDTGDDIYYPLPEE